MLIPAAMSHVPEDEMHWGQLLLRTLVALCIVTVANLTWRPPASILEARRAARLTRTAEGLDAGPPAGTSAPSGPRAGTSGSATAQTVRRPASPVAWRRGQAARP